MVVQLVATNGYLSQTGVASIISDGGCLLRPGFLLVLFKGLRLCLFVDFACFVQGSFFRENGQVTFPQKWTGHFSAQMDRSFVREHRQVIFPQK